MKKQIERIRYWLFPKIDRETDVELDAMNLTNIYFVSLVLCVVQAILLAGFSVVNYQRLGERACWMLFCKLASGAALCFAACVIAAAMRRAGFFRRRHAAVNVFATAYFVVMVVWALFVSARPYLRGEQIVSFYTVQLCGVLFIKLRPVFTASMILASYAACFIWYDFFLDAGKISLYSFVMLGVISAAGAVANYRLTVNHLQQKNRAEKLNKSLEVIANHDSTTGLQNRYALNMRINGCLNCDLCVAMGDINSFKLVNDTYGHHMGDVMLKHFAEILTRYFPSEAVFRYGGDEFLVISPGDDLDAFRETLNRVNRDFAATRPDGFELEPGCSFGCVTGHPESAADFFNMMQKADQNLYSEKRKIKQEAARKAAARSVKIDKNDRNNWA